MAKTNKMRKKSDTRHHGGMRYRLPSCCSEVSKDVHQKIYSKTSQKKEWKNVSCSVCMEYPHNAVLLLCSSYDKGCRPYMCATSYRFSNCLDQYKKAYTKVNSINGVQPWHGAMEEDDLNYNSEFGCPIEKVEVAELLCPLCRGQVKGWTVVEPARKYLNNKKRNCMQDNCSFVGTYKELRKHVKIQHPWARPREVDPSHAEKWKMLEHEREVNDVMSTIRSTTPGAIIIGDYVIERNARNYHGFMQEYDVDDYFDEAFFSLESYDEGMDDSFYNDIWDEENFGSHHSRGTPASSGRILHMPHSRDRFFLGSRRRRRQRAVNGR